MVPKYLRLNAEETYLFLGVRGVMKGALQRKKWVMERHISYLRKIYPINFLHETVDMQSMYAMLMQLSLVKSAIVI